MAALRAVAAALAEPVQAEAAALSATLAASEGGCAGERTAQCESLRCIFGSPFRPARADSAWLAWHEGAVRNLAEAVYEERDPLSGHLDAARLGVLADLLEEAGCSDPQLLGHLRGPGPHVRGCHASDALLGQS